MSVISFNPKPIARRSRRGTASVEAIVVLPVFIIIFVSVFYVRNQVLSRQAAEFKARTCVWAYSMNNCNEVPAGCDGILQPVDGAGNVDEKVEEKLDKAKTGLVGQVIAKVLEPVLKAAFGRAVQASTRESYQRPALYGGGTATANGSYRLACNLTPETLTDVAQDAWKSLSKF